MTDGISVQEFSNAGVDDWRVLSEGASAFFRTGSFAAAARFVGAIGGLPGLDGHPPDVDIRHDGVTVRLITIADDWFGVGRRDVELARQVSAVARDLGVAADPSAVQTLLIVPGAPVTAEVMPFWRAVLGYEPRADSPDEDLVDPHRLGPSFWFESMREARGDGGGAIHVAVWVPYEQAEARVAAALAAGGQQGGRRKPPPCWTVAHPGANEAA